MSKHILTRVIAVPVVLAIAAPMLVPAAPAFANTTQVTIRAIESDDGKQEAGSYDKTGGIGLAPLIAVAGASSVACLTLAHRLGKGDDDEKTIA
ncbi:hypothetical protein MKC95_21765 [[Clostridium] innocuum]|uniref:Uncharacterized protein n=1 Tax=Clostridium innocuum TaxID=1522 RepID=A0AAP2URX7_CLOIN|nr:hypothetical protein [[Clostridium] innocuum]